MKKELKDKIEEIISQHLMQYEPGDYDYIYKGIQALCPFPLNIKSGNRILDDKTFQNSISKINERDSRRKKEGVYYTPTDVTEYIFANTLLNFIDKQTKQVYSADECVKRIAKSNEKVDKITVFDPTCGTAEFLVSALRIKIGIMETQDDLKDSNIIQAVSSLYGNDISEESVLLSKIRIYFSSISYLKNKRNIIKISERIEKNFTHIDYVVAKDFCPKYDIIVGNPPYVEYTKVEEKPEENLGNIYANVLRNACDNVKKGGVIGFVLPVSYVSTPRMGKIRNYTYQKMSKLFVLNFADRPDCLFDGVHQKLTVLFAVKGKEKCEVFSSSYYHWYNNERKTLLDGCAIFPVKATDKYIPKIGNAIENSIFTKIVGAEGLPIASVCNTDKGSYLYLNMRGCFWMKAFSKNPGSKEYNEISCSSEKRDYIISILNSNLFFFFWTIVSDCWHITAKELSTFIVPINNVDFESFHEVRNNLERKLEQTKKYIGTKQTEYEYKHKECKNEIDAIDDALKDIYNLTQEEISYLKAYKLKYRMSNG